MKKLLPRFFRSFLWWVFKAPQRKWIGYSTLLTDIAGYLEVLFQRKSYRRISVCVGVKDRSYNLLSCVVRSLNEARFYTFIELSVYDCGSEDLPGLENNLRMKWKGRLVYREEKQEFTRSKAFNEAVMQSTSDLVLICDADMSVPEDIVEKISKYCTKRSAWFPKIWYAEQSGAGRFLGEGTGICAMRKEDFVRAGKYDESIKEWGKEDWMLYFACYKHKIACIRTRERHFVHKYHPSLKPKDFVPLF